MMLQKNSTMYLANLNNHQLMNLFTVTASPVLSQRALAILTELLKRGYFFDVRRRRFLTSAEWKLFYQAAPPADYFAYWEREHNEQPSTRRKVGT